MREPASGGRPSEGDMGACFCGRTGGRRAVPSALVLERQDGRGGRMLRGEAGDALPCVDRLAAILYQTRRCVGRPLERATSPVRTRDV